MKRFGFDYYKCEKCKRNYVIARTEYKTSEPIDVGTWPYIPSFNDLVAQALHRARGIPKEYYRQGKHERTILLDWEADE
jgi:hypothetical protein